MAIFLWFFEDIHEHSSINKQDYDNKQKKNRREEKTILFFFVYSSDVVHLDLENTMPGGGIEPFDIRLKSDA